MTKDKSILIKNIYYMLTYAFQVLKQTNYDEIASEEFENIQDLFAAILSKGIAQQVKQGLYREYVTENQDLSVLRGKIDINGTIRNKMQRKQILSCEYDDLSENNKFNQILKVSAGILLRQPSVNVERRKALKKIMPYFDGVDSIERTSIQWERLHYRRNNQSYKMLMNICFFILEGLLISTAKGEYKIASFLDEQRMSRLFEKFVLEYFRYHHPNLKVSASQVAWNVDDGVIDFLPVMQTDIMIRFKGKTLIIDTKYYGSSMQIQSRFDSQTLHSHNLYQIFTYVKNQDIGSTGNVAGMLLYAKTEEEVTPDNEFHMSGNKIYVKTLDLNKSFENITAQLNHLVESYFATKVAEDSFHFR